MNQRKKKVLASEKFLSRNFKTVIYMCVCLCYRYIFMLQIYVLYIMLYYTLYIHGVVEDKICVSLKPDGVWSYGPFGS